MPLIESTSKGRCLESARAEVESEIDNGREPLDGLGGKHRAVAQRSGERRLQVVRQIDLGFVQRDRRVLRITQMSVTNRPVARRTDVRVGAAKIGSRHSMEALESL